MSKINTTPEQDELIQTLILGTAIPPEHRKAAAGLVVQTYSPDEDGSKDAINNEHKHD